MHAAAVGLLALTAVIGDASATGGESDVLQTIAEVLSLPTDVRDRGASVRVRAVVTMWQPEQAIGVIQDATAGIWTSCTEPAIRERVQGVIRPGMEVVVAGSLYRGGYSPLLLVDTIEFVKEVELPPSRHADLERIFVGADNGLRIQCEGVVQGCQPGGSQASLALACGARRMAVQVLDASGLPRPEALVDARVSITGVVGSVRNTRGEFLAPRLVANTAGDVVVLEPAPASPDEVPTIPLAEIGRYRFDPLTSRRIATEGVVTYASPTTVFIQQGVRGVRVTPAAGFQPAVAPGDRVRVRGFIDTVRRIAGIREATIERIDAGEPPVPMPVSPAAVLQINTAAMSRLEMAEPSDYDGCLVEFRATVAEIRPRGDAGGDLTLTGDGVSTLATLDEASFALLPRLDPGAVVRVRGVVQIHLLGDDVAGSGIMIPMLRQVTVLPRSAADIEVLVIPSWWTPRRLATLLAGVAAILIGALFWVGLLRREVQSQARLLAREMRLRRDAAIEYEASLRERNRLAANLHDTLLQTLGGIAYQLGACRARSQGAADAAEHLEVAGRMVDHATKELRGSVWALRTMPVVGDSFPDSLQTLLNQLSLGRSERLSLAVDGHPFAVPNFVAGNLLLVAQEAILNALHHGHCGHVATTVTFEEPQAAIELAIRDDGAGFLIGSQAGPEQGHFGLQGMRERIERLGGSITITSTPGSGTRVQARVLIRDYDSDLDDAPAVDDAARTSVAALFVALALACHGPVRADAIAPGLPPDRTGDIWISPAGDDGNPGTEQRPRRSLEAAIETIAPGHTIWLLPGTYAFTDTVQIPKTKQGTAAAPYRLSGRRGLPRPKLDFTGVSRSSEIRGLQVDGQYWHLCSLEIHGASDNNVNVAGSNNLLELLDIHDAGDTGLQINSTSSLLPSGNRILNCDSYLNADTSAEDADGFAAKLIIGPGNSFEGCRAWHNCDDNWDLYDAQAVVTLKGCWAIQARHPTKSRKNSDGNGFKLGGIRKDSSGWNKRNAFASYEAYVQANDNPHVLEGCFAIGNPAWGFHRNGNPSMHVTCRDCGAWDNGKGGYSKGLQVVGEDASAPTVTAAAAIAAERDATGNLPAMRSLVPTDR